MNKATMKKLESMDACAAGMAWFKTQPNLKTAWKTCQRPDWMLWLLGRTTPDSEESKKLFRMATCRFARLVIHLTASDEAEQALCMAEQFLAGDDTITVEDLRLAAYAAAHAAYAAAHAAYAAAYAADAAWAAAAAHAAYADAAREDMQARCADIIRDMFCCPKL